MVTFREETEVICQAPVLTFRGRNGDCNCGANCCTCALATTVEAAQITVAKNALRIRLSLLLVRWNLLLTAAQTTRAPDYPMRHCIQVVSDVQIWQAKSKKTNRPRTSMPRPIFAWEQRGTLPTRF